MAWRRIVAIAYLLILEKDIAVKEGSFLPLNIKCLISGINRLIEPLFNLVDIEISALRRLSEL
jgi:hypothetical protein